MIYLDYAAATPTDPAVIREMLPYLTEHFYNPSASYLAAKQVRDDLEKARGELARVLGAKPAELIMTAGATESINLALRLAGGDGTVMAPMTEHASVRTMVKALGGTLISVKPDGLIDIDQLKNQISDNIKVLSVGYVNSETGTVQPISRISQIVQDINQDRQARGINLPLYLHTDASQAVGVCDINVARLGVDMLTLNGAKCYGTKQSGLLYVRAGIELTPVIYGGGQERGVRSGTENVPAIIGLAKAVTIAEHLRDSEVKRLGQLKKFLLEELQASIPDLKVNGTIKQASPAILNVSIDGIDGERVVYGLDQEGVAVATGSACSANKNTRSTVLSALGLTDSQVDGSIRISMGRGTTEPILQQAVQLIIKVINQQRKFKR